MQNASYFRELARRCRAFTKVAIDPEVRGQLLVWAVELADEADTVVRCAPLTTSVIRGCDLSTGPEGLQIEFREAFLAGRFVSDVALERIRDDTADRGQLVGHFENAGSIGVAHQPPGAGSFTPAVGASQ